MEIVTGLIGFVFGAIIAILAKYRNQDIDAENAAKAVTEDHEREMKLAFLNGYMFRYRKEKEKAVYVGDSPARKTAKCEHCGLAHHSSYCET